VKRQAGFLIEKRDGRREWLRTTKLARSLHAALAESGVDDEWLAIDLAGVVVADARSRAAAAPCLSTAALAEAAVRVLLAAGQPRAAAAYQSVGRERTRRRLVLVDAGGRLGTAPAASPRGPGSW